MRPAWFIDRSRNTPHSLDRRTGLKLAAAGVLGMTLPECLAWAASANAPTGRRRAAVRNVLVILEQGGLSHIDTWDPKPEAISDHRSPYAPIATSVPGMRFTGLLPKTACLADKLTVIRSFHHARGGADAHPNGTQYVLSGSHPAGPLVMPDIGSITSHLIGSECRYLPPYIMVPGNHEQAAETRNGFLPTGTRVFKTGGRDVSDPAWTIAGIVPRADLAEGRLSNRRRLAGSVGAIDSPSSDGRGMNPFFDQAFDMLTSARVSEAFDLKREPHSIRERYGRGHRGACYLVGRKLIEAGVRFVTVDTRWPMTPETPRGGNLNWDHHDFIYANDTCELPGAGGAGAGRYGIGHWVMMGSVDQAYSALIADLDQRGLLAETLVCFVTEFGRTPRINPTRGRDHWTHAYSMVFAGAGVPGGQVVGRSDREGGYVIEHPFTPENYASTIYEKLGIDRGQPIYTPNNRPVYFGHAAEPIPQLFR